MSSRDDRVTRRYPLSASAAVRRTQSRALTDNIRAFVNEHGDVLDKVGDVIMGIYPFGEKEWGDRDRYQGREKKRIALCAF